MSFRDKLFERLSPELMSGVKLGQWLRILAENRFAVDLPYWPRAGVTTLLSLRNSMIGAVEELRFSKRIDETSVESPVFVLGIFRSGTTYLHNLLSQDPRFAFPTHYEVAFPHTFLSLEKIDALLLGSLLPSRRPQDNFALSFNQPHEDEVALSSMIGRTFMMDLAFPRNAELYRRYYTLEGLSDDELRQWKEALKRFLKKVAFKNQRRLIMKSPGHTCRVKTLLEMFPDARFVHIRRNPLHVYRSWQHTIQKISPRWTFQHPRDEQLEDDIVNHYRRVYDVWFRDRELIPAGHLFELSYEDLIRDPLDQLRRMYSALDLPDFEDSQPNFSRFLMSHSNYQNNNYHPLPEPVRQRLATEWKPFFDAWGYSV